MSRGDKASRHRASPNITIENALWRQGLTYIAGIDEAGRGALAGPVTAAAVILPQMPDLIQSLNGVRDSKMMSPIQRDKWRRLLEPFAISFGTGSASPREIDMLGIVSATRLAAHRAIHELSVPPDYLLLDYILLPEIPIPQTALPKGDVHSLSIAAASIIAKTTRDDYMRDIDKQYPSYGFTANKGYGTELHRSVLAIDGPTAIHRFSFSPLRDKKK